MSAPAPASLTFLLAAPWNQGPVSQQFRALADALVGRGHSVVYLCAGRAVHEDHGRLHVRSFPSSRPTRPADFRFLHRTIRQYRPDCTIANFGATNAMAVVGSLHRVPCRVHWYHTITSAIRIDGARGSRRLALLERRKRLVHALATDLVANSEDARRDAVRTYALDPARAHVLPNSLADPGGPPLRAADRAPVLVCPGRFAATKGQDVLLHALSLLVERGLTPETRFLGAGDQEAACRALADRLGVADQCVFRGEVRHADLLGELRRAMVTVVPSRSEAFGFVNIESMAVGTPVVASAVGGIPEVVRDGVEGLLVPPDDPAALADALERLLTDEAERAALGDAGRRRFLERFEQGRVAEVQAQRLESLALARCSGRRRFVGGDGGTRRKTVIGSVKDLIGGSLKSVRTRARMRRRRSDYARWADGRSLSPSWDTRTLRLAELVPAGAAVLELGAGRCVLRDRLPEGCTYTPADLVDRGPGTVVFDLNAPVLPPLEGYDVVLCSGVLEYVLDVPRLVDHLSGVRSFVVSYATREGTPAGRRAHGWVNDFTADELAELFRRRGFVCSHREPWGTQELYRFDRC